METLIFYTYEFAASILPFSAAFIFLSHKQKKWAEKKTTSSARPCFYFFLPSTSYVYITSQEPALYGMHFCIASKQKFPTLILSPFCGNRYGRIYFEYHPVHSVWVFDPFNLAKK